MSESRDLVSELLGEQKTPVMPEARKTRRKRKLQNLDDIKSKRIQDDSPSYAAFASSSGDDNASNEALPATPPIKQTVPPAPYKNKPQEVRLPLGGDIYLTVGLFRDKPLVSVRQFYHPDPANPNNVRAGRQGLSMTPHHWDTLKAQPVLGSILDCMYACMPYPDSVDDLPFQPATFELGDERFLTVQKVSRQPSISLYQMYKPYGSPDTAHRLKKGIDLTLEQWHDIENKMGTVDKILAEMERGKLPVNKDLIQSTVVY